VTSKLSKSLAISRETETVAVFKRLFEEAKTTEKKKKDLIVKLKQEEQISLFKTLKDSRFTNPHKNLTDLVIKMSLKDMQDRLTPDPHTQDPSKSMDLKQVIDYISNENESLYQYALKKWQTIQTDIEKTMSEKNIKTKEFNVTEDHSRQSFRSLPREVRV